MSTDDRGDATGGLCGLPHTNESGSPRPRSSSTTHDGDAGHATRLRRTIETEIVPRLLAARGRLPMAPESTRLAQCVASAVERHVAPGDCLELQRLLLAHESTVAGAYVEALIAQGVPRDEVYMDLLVPVARGFGQLWEDDAADFTQITVALGRLQVLLHELGRDSCESATPGQGMRSVLLVPVPGEQHTFGLLVIGDFFRRRGWNVCCEFPKSPREVIELAANNHFDVVGLSLAADQKVEDLTALLPGLRRSSQNGTLRILVGGPLFLRRPELACEIGADGTAENGDQAVSEAERLVDKLDEMH